MRSGNFTMSIQEPVKTRYVSAIVIAIRHISAVGIALLFSGIAIAQVRVVGVGIFQSHERVGLLADLLFHARVCLKIRIELRMALQHTTFDKEDNRSSLRLTREQYAKLTRL